MKNMKFVVWAHFAFLIAILAIWSTQTAAATSQSTTQSASQTITEADGYKLLARIVVGKLEDMYGVPITYEDTLHVHESERSKNDPMKLMPEKMSITYTITPPPSGASLSVRKAMAGEVLRDVVEKYNKMRGTEMYQITETDIGFHVIARQFLNVSGKMEDFQPTLDTPITIEPEERVPSDILNEISKQINATNQPFTVSYAPLGGSTNLGHKVKISASNEPARSVIDRLFKEAKAVSPYPNEQRYYSWEMNTWGGPGSGGIMFINVVRAPETP